MRMFLLLLSVTFSLNSYAFIDSVMSRDTQKIVLPCAVAIVGGQMVNSIEAGVLACGVVATYHLIQNDNEKRTSDAVQEIHSLYEKHERSLLEHRRKTDEEYASYREAIREVVIERLVEGQNYSMERVKEIMNTPEFDVFLKEKTSKVLDSTNNLVVDKLIRIKKEIKDETIKAVIELYSSGKSGE